MALEQKLELRKYLTQQLKQSLSILACPLLEIKQLVEKELENNPFLEEIHPVSATSLKNAERTSYKDDTEKEDLDFRLNLLTKKISLQDILLRQLGMFTNADEDFIIGQEIIGNIDENGYLKASLDEIANTLKAAREKVENVLKVIQQFEPAGVGARTLSECLLIQLESADEKNPLLRKIIEEHLEDVAKKRYNRIVKSLKEPLKNIEPLIKKILKLNPKPGRNFSQDEINHIIPDVIIELKDDEKDGGLEISINNEDIPFLSINRAYKDMLKNKNLDPQTKEFLSNKLRNAQELLRAISKRKDTLRKIIEIVVEIQSEAIKEDLSFLKPLTFKKVAQKIDMHESTVCRAVMNKYVKTPYGIVALKDFFSSHIHDQNGQSISSNYVKRLIKELIGQEDKKHPLSDEGIARILSKENGLKLARRTIAKYRKELKILSSAFRKER